MIAPIVGDGPAFQYSLCRVVLMVLLSFLRVKSGGLCFSTRSVESF